MGGRVKVSGLDTVGCMRSAHCRLLAFRFLCYFHSFCSPCLRLNIDVQTRSPVFSSSSLKIVFTYAAISRLAVFVAQVRAMMSSDDVTSPFVAVATDAPAGSSICNNMTHRVTWSITNYVLRIQVDSNVPETFSFNGFVPCPDLDAPLYLGGVKG